MSPLGGGLLCLTWSFFFSLEIGPLLDDRGNICRVIIHRINTFMSDKTNQLNLVYCEIKKPIKINVSKCQQSH